MNDDDNTRLGSNINETTAADNNETSGGTAPDNSTTITRQWYLSNPDIQYREIQEMFEFKPDAMYGYLPNGKMFWNVRIRPVVCGKRKDWSLLLIYHDSYSQSGCGENPISIYPIKPSAGEMLVMMRGADIPTMNIPRTTEDSCAQIRLDVSRRVIRDGQGNEDISAVAYLKRSMRWITTFELGLIDKEAWSNFADYSEVEEEATPHSE